MSAIHDGTNLPDGLPDHLHLIGSVLQDFETVVSLTAPERYPPRLSVTLSVTDLKDAPGVGDVVDTFDARITRPRLSTDGGSIHLQFDLKVPRPFVQDGTPKLREHGNSHVASMSKDVIDRADFDIGDELAVLARSGEIRLIHAEQYPDEIETLPADDLLPAGSFRE